MQKMHIDADVPKTFASDYGAELDEVKEYNACILVCGDAKDYASREILKHILSDKNGHIDSIEAV